MAKDKKDIVYDLFAEQAAECRIPLPFKELDNKKCPEYIRRVLLVDPAPLYERVRYEFDPFTRYNFISFEKLFPDNPDHLCSCGCGVQLKKKQPKWASTTCQRYARAVWDIMSCRQPPMITFYLSFYWGIPKCMDCGGEFTDLDHHIPCKAGGGGSWISNYRFLCLSCHAKKTAVENNWLNSKHLDNKNNG